jgi:hypothetical protein
LGKKLLGSIHIGKKDPFCYEFKNVFALVVEPFIGSKDLDEVSQRDIQKLVVATTSYQARLALVIIKTIFRDSKLYGIR